MAITNKQIEELQQRRLELELQLKQHEAGMRRKSFGDYQKKYKKKKDVVKEIIKETPKKELTEVMSEAAAEEPDVEYALTPKALELASKISQTKSYQDMVSFSPTTTPIPNIVTPDIQKEDNQKKQDEARLKNKEPEYSSIAPTAERPVKVNDTISDIFAKLFIFIRKGYVIHRKQKRDDVKYYKMIEKKKEIRIEELIKAFGGKIKGKKVKEETKTSSLKMITLGGLGLILTFKAKEVFASVPDFKAMLKKQLPSWMTGGEETTTTTGQGQKPLLDVDTSTARGSAEQYLGRKMSDREWSELLRTTAAEASANEKEEAYVMASILNRAKNPEKYISKSDKRYGDETILTVLYAKNQFAAVTGDNKKPGPSEQFLKGPSKKRIESMSSAAVGILPKVSTKQTDFTAMNEKAYKKPGAGQNIGYRNKLLAKGGTVIGGSVFNTGDVETAKTPTPQPKVQPNTKQTSSVIVPMENTVAQNSENSALVNNVNNVVNKSTTMAVTQVNKSNKPILMDVSYG